MTNAEEYDTIVIGAGAAGLVVAKGLAKAQKKVLLVEKGPYGGDCANFGCIPTKSLIASANMAHELWRAAFYGIDMKIGGFQASRVMQRVREIVATLREKNSPCNLQAIGIETFTGSAAFLDPYRLELVGLDGQKRRVTAKNILIATGSTPIIPDIKGLSDVPYMTNLNVFDLKEIPVSMAIVGGGQIGCELAQAFRRLGSSVIIVEKEDYLLGREEPEAHRMIQSHLVKEGVEIYVDHEVVRFRKEGDRIVLSLRRQSDDKEYEVFVHQLLIAAGRKPNIQNLQLEKAGVVYTNEGIVVDAYMRTVQPHIWAVGDATGKSFYTHAAENQARTVLANLLLPWPFKVKMDREQAIPRITFTDPQVASLGLTEVEAIERYGAGKIATHIVPLTESDQAICQGRSSGFVKFVVKKYSSRILGATIVAPIAADMLLEISVAMRAKMPLRKLAGLIHPYPTYSQIIRKAADRWIAETILPYFYRHPIE